MEEPVDWGGGPVKGTVVFDARRESVGVVQAREPGGKGVVWLRPVGGGVEWTARPADLSPVTREQEVSAKVAAANRRSRLNEWELS